MGSKENHLLAEQLEVIRASGKFNMLDFNGVHQEANRLEFYELVVWMAEHGTKDYSEVLFSGQFPDEE